MAILNDRIKERRTELGLTLFQVADLLGVREATAQRYESGEIKNIKHEIIVNLAEILHCSPAYLMGWEDKNNTEAIHSNMETELLDIFNSLNNLGKKASIERLKELKCVPKYKNR